MNFNLDKYIFAWKFMHNEECYIIVILDSNHSFEEGLNAIIIEQSFAVLDTMKSLI